MDSQKLSTNPQLYSISFFNNIYLETLRAEENPHNDNRFRTHRHGRNERVIAVRVSVPLPITPTKSVAVYIIDYSLITETKPVNNQAHRKPSAVWRARSRG